MEKLVSICRVCLNENAQHIENTQLLKMYEKLTTSLFQTDMTPLSLCNICNAELTASWRFMLKCLKAEELFTQMLDQLLTNKDEVKTPTPRDQSAINQLSISSIEHTIIDSDVPNVDTLLKEEEEEDINSKNGINILFEEDVKLEQSEELETVQDTPYSLYLEPSIEQRVTDPEVHIPMNNIKPDIETVREQKTDTVEERNGLEKGVVNIIEKPKCEPEFNKSTKCMKSTNADTDYCIYVNKFVPNNRVKCYYNRKNKRVSENHDISEQRTFEQRNLSNNIYGQSSFTKESNLSLCTEEKLICDYCMKSFKRKHNLMVHLRSHKNEITHVCNKCNVCKKCFKRKEHLKRHMLVHTGLRPHICNVCNKSFIRKEQLTYHELVHTTEKPHVCPVCNKCFKRKSYLITHSRVHTRKRLYVRVQ